MSDSRWQRIKDLFADAIALEPGEREALLAREGATDPELRREVESLLRAHRPSVGVESDTETLSERPGMHVGPYKLLEEIGEGGFGVVFLAEQESPVRRRVALKVIKPGMDTRQIVARFEQERQALAMMDHPGIARVFDAGTTASGRPYFVMELVRGDPITIYCDREKLTTAERLRLFAEVCRAVQHAHQKGVIHRDLKPGNVLVTIVDGKPVPKVIDFGVAKATQGRLTDKTLFTAHRQIIGTPLYMSPEQAQLSGVDVDTRSDVYSLGVLLYELLVGVPPFGQEQLMQAGFAEMYRMIRELEPQKPSTRVATLGPSSTAVAAQRGVEARRLGVLLRGDLDWIVMRCLEKERARRYDTASDLAQDLERHLAGEPVEAAPPSAMYRVRKMVRRRRGVFAAGTVVLAVALLGAAATFWQAERARDLQSTRAEEALASVEGLRLLTEQAEVERRAAERAQKESEFEAYVANVGAASTALDANDVTTMRSRLDACPEGLRNWEWRYLNTESDGAVAVVHDRRTWVETAWVAPYWDGETADWWDADQGRVMSAPSDIRGNAILCATRIPNGARIVESHWEGDRPFARVVDMVQGETRTVADLPLGAVEAEPVPTDKHDSATFTGGFSPDGRWLMTICTSASSAASEVWSTSNWKRTTARPDGFAAFSEDGTCLICYEAAGEPEIIDPSNGAMMARLHGHQGWVSNCRFSRDGAKVVTASWDGTARVWNVATGAQVAVLGDHKSPLLDACFTPDGRRVVTGGQDGTVRVWDVEKQEAIGILQGHAGQVRRVACSPDGAWIATASLDNTVCIWNAATDAPIAILKGHTDVIYSAVFSPDGAWLVTSSWDGTKRIWDCSSWSATASVKEYWSPRDYLYCYERNGRDVPGRVAFAADGKSIIASYAVFDAVTGCDLDSLMPSRSVVGIAQLGRPPGKVLVRTRENTLAVLRLHDEDSDVTVWDVQAGVSVRHLSGSEGPIMQARADGGGHLLATLSTDGAVRVWNLDSGLSRGVVARDTSIRLACPDPAGKRLLICSTQARIIDSGTGDTLASLSSEWPEGTFACEPLWSPDGKIVVGMRDPNTPFLWDASTGNTIGPLRGHSGMVHCVAFSPDGSRIVTASSDRLVKVWDTARQREVASLPGHTGMVLSVAFSPDAMKIVSASSDGTCRLWDSTPVKEHAAAVHEMRGAVEKMRPLVAGLQAEFPESPWEALSADPSLTQRERLAGAALLCERERTRRAHYSMEVRALVSPSATPQDAASTLKLIEEELLRNPDDFDVLESRGMALYRVGKYQESRQSLQEGHPLTRGFVAMVCSRLGEKEEAREALDLLRGYASALESGPNSDAMLLPEAEAVFAECFPNDK